MLLSGDRREAIPATYAPLVRIAFVTADDPRTLAEDVDRPLHDDALAARGATLDHVSWHDPAADWAGYDLVVLRSPWDYPEHLDELDAFLGRVGGLPTLHNPAALVRWNLDKRYLGELAAAGVAVVPTRVADDADELAAALDALAADPEVDEVVVKPVVGAGSRLTGRFAADDPAAAALGRQALAGGQAALVQPCIPSVAERGEVAVLVFDGEVSHALTKGPILAPGGGFLGGEYHEEVAATTPDGATTALVDAAHDGVRSIAEGRGWLPPGQPLLYARFDVVEAVDGAPLLLEAELFEPCFFLPTAPGAADRFADAVLRRAATR